MKTHAEPRITELTFWNALTEGPRRFPAREEIGSIWRTLIDHGVDPSFALGQFWAESLFGTDGWNKWVPELHSWGNILYPNTALRREPGVGVYEASNGYNYTTYPDWTTGVRDYCLLLASYEVIVDQRYGDTTEIYGASAKWAGKPPGSEEHLRYFNVIMQRLERYDAAPEWKGAMATLCPPGVIPVSNSRYAIKAGDRWYTQIGGSTSYQFRAPTALHFFGPVVEGTSWFQVRIYTSRFSGAPGAASRYALVFMPNFDKARMTILPDG